MKYILIFVIGFLSFVVGVFGFYQIIGSIRIAIHQRKEREAIEELGGRVRPISLVLFTVLLWTAIIAFAIFAVHTWLSNYNVSSYIGFGIAFLLSLRAGESKEEFMNASNIKGYF